MYRFLSILHINFFFSYFDWILTGYNINMRPYHQNLLSNNIIGNLHIKFIFFLSNLLILEVEYWSSLQSFTIIFLLVFSTLAEGKNVIVPLISIYRKKKKKKGTVLRVANQSRFIIIVYWCLNSWSSIEHITFHHHQGKA